MKKFISRTLLAVLLVTQVSNSYASADLGTIVQKYDYQLQTQNLTETQKQELMSKMNVDIQNILATSSAEEILENLNSLVADMPEGSQKTKIQKIVSENSSNPEIALEEINNLNLLGSMQSGDSANWSVIDSIDNWIATHPLLTIGIFAVAITASYLYTENIKKQKNKELDELLAERRRNGDTEPGFTTVYYGTAEYTPATFEECKISSPTVQTIIDQATAQARAGCGAQPKVNQGDCSTNKAGITLQLVSKTRCVATASVVVTILRVQ